MNLNSNPTIEQLRDLIKRGDDYAGDHVLWVRQTGDVEMSTVPHGQALTGLEKANPDMKLRLETLEAGNEYIGPDAAADDEWIAELFDILMQEWPKAKTAAGAVYFGEVTDGERVKEVSCPSS